MIWWEWGIIYRWAKQLHQGERASPNHTYSPTTETYTNVVFQQHTSPCHTQSPSSTSKSEISCHDRLGIRDVVNIQSVLQLHLSSYILSGISSTGHLHKADTKTRVSTFIELKCMYTVKFKFRLSIFLDKNDSKQHGW